MTIKSVTIKNVRGFNSHKIDLNMIPNKPSLLVAPNGSGKSSFALAFQSLNKNALKVPDEEIYNNVATNQAELIVDTDFGTFSANSGNNTISNNIAIYVINNQNKPKTSIRSINGVRTASTKMCVDPIVLVNKIPENKQITYSFEKDYKLTSLTKGTIPSIRDLLNNYDYMSEFDISDLKNVKRQWSDVVKFLEKLPTYTGPKKSAWKEIEQDWLLMLKKLPILNARIDNLRGIYKEDSEILLYIKIVQLIDVFQKETEAFKARIAFSKYKKEHSAYMSLFDSLKKTWKGIKPQETAGKLVVEIPDTNRLSNGERDIIVFFAMLSKAEIALTKERNILIIDEIFDYLDDANMVAAQYYLTKFIAKIKKSRRYIYPIIMSHLNPEFFKSYAFSELKVYYLKPYLIPVIYDKMKKLLWKRSELERSAEQDDVISKYLLHFYPDYSQDLIGILGENFRPWNDPKKFKAYCFKETEKYLQNSGDSYDAVAVCIVLRECIEKYLYINLPSEKKNELFEKKQNGTNNKIAFAEGNGVECPEIFYLLGLIYNNPLHLESGQTKDLRQTLYSRLQNNTIRSMIDYVVGMYKKLESQYQTM